MFWDFVRDLAENHRFKVLGALLGFNFALMVMRFGLLWTLFIGGCAALGYWLGKRLDEEPESLAEALERLRPPVGR